MNGRIARAAIVVLAAWAFTASVPVGAQQVRDARKPVTAPGLTGTSALAGIVTNDDGSRPVRFAYVVLIGTGKGTVKVTSTDAEGRFSFANLPADRYTVGASKPPYLGAVAGARRPARPGTPIALEDGQKIANVAIRMPMGGAIAGVITDEQGLPGSNAMVTLQQWRMQGTERTLVSAGMTSADDRGRYRFFGLAPGEYLVAAMRGGVPPPGLRTLTTGEVDAALKGGPVAPSPLTPSNIRYAPVYFPGTTRASDAASIVLAAGEERSNVDFRLELVQIARIEGTVSTSDGQPMAPIPVLVTTAGANVLRTATIARVMPDGRFVAANVMPGTYALIVTGNGPLAGQFATATVEVAGADVFGVQLTMRPSLSLSGRLVFQGAAAAPALAGRRIPVQSISSSLTGVPGPNVALTNQTGGFTISNIFPGRYVIGGPLAFGPTSDTMTWVLESVVIDGRDVTDLPVDISAETAPKEVVVTFSDRHQGLSGRLTRSTGAPVSEHTIIVFPEDKAYWMSGSRRIVTTRPGTDGRFTLSAAGPTTLPPGKYLLAAVTDVDRNEQFDPAFLAALVPAAVPITLQPGEKKVQDLVVK